MVTVAERAQKESSALQLLLETTRALLWVRSPEDGRRAAADFVTGLGGQVVPASDQDGDCLPVDLSFGDGPVVLPSSPADSVTRMLLQRYLPTLVTDVQRAVALGSEADRLADDASIDSLTKLPNRRMLGRALGRLQPGGTVIMLDLDHFKVVNDTLGHAVGDEVLRALGSMLNSEVRGRDIVARYGGEEFVIVMTSGGDADAVLTRLRERWVRNRPLPITFSAGVAIAEADPASALLAADRAMYRAKEAGRDQWAWALECEYTPRGDEERDERRDEHAPHPVVSDFVAYSQITVPVSGREALETAFLARLGAVDSWPGFHSLQVWDDLADPTAYVMVSWWAREEDFAAYMGSDEHRSSHRRIPTGENRPRAAAFHRFRVIAS